MPFWRKRNETGNQFEGMIGQGKKKKNEAGMADFMVDLEQSKKKHSSHKDSALQSSQEYQNVQKAIENVAFSTGWDFSEDVASNEKMMTEAMGNYYKLLAACEAYIAKPGGFSLSGRSRKSKVKEIQKNAQRDLLGIEQTFHAMKSMNGFQQSTLSWDEIMHSSRLEKLEVEDYDSLKDMGANSKKGNFVGKRMKEGVFAPESFHNYSVKHNEANIDSPGNVMRTAALSSLLAEQKTTTSMSNRNIATSRVANLIGLGDIVAQSTAAVVKDKKSGEERKGSLMALANGVEMKGEVSQKISGKMKMVSDIGAREQMAKATIAPSMQKELSSLQVLDYLCAQGDRHTGNYFVTQGKDGRYDHIQGIDNDLSFSTGVDAESHLRSLGGAYAGDNNMRMVIDSSNNLTIPHMDKQLAKNILELKPDELRFALKDILEEVFVELTVVRLKKLQNGIRNEMGKKDSKLFLDEGEWDEGTLEDFIAASSRRAIDQELEGTDRTEKRQFYYLRKANAYDITQHDSYVSQLIDTMVGYNRMNANYSV